MNVVLDSNVLVAAVKPTEPAHDEARRVLDTIRARRDVAFVPATALWEIGAALSHSQKTPKGTKFATDFNLTVEFVPIDERLFRAAWAPDIRAPIKGYDRVFISCAVDKAAVLITTDAALLEHGAAFGVRVLRPAEYLNDSR